MQQNLRLLSNVLRHLYSPARMKSLLSGIVKCFISISNIMYSVFSCQHWHQAASEDLHRQLFSNCQWLIASTVQPNEKWPVTLYPTSVFTNYLISPPVFPSALSSFQSVVIPPSGSVAAEKEETQRVVHFLRLPQEPQLHHLQSGLGVSAHWNART